MDRQKQRIRQGRRPLRAGRPNDPQDRPAEQRIWPIRWGRIYAALALIALAVVWLALDAHFGIVSSNISATPTAVLSRAVPALGTPQMVQAATFNAKLIGTQASAGSLDAPNGSHFLVIAVLVVNHGRAQLRISPTDFHLRNNDRDVAVGIPFPGHTYRMFSSALSPGAQAQAVLLLQAQDHQPSGVLAYVPASGPTEALLWTLP